MKAKNIIISATLALALTSGLTACKSQADKDKELKAKVEAVAPGVTVTVNNGTVTLSGSVNDATQKQTLEDNIKKVDGVKSVTNQLEVPPPPTISPDGELTNVINNIIKDYPTVKATVLNGEVTLTGEIKRDDLAQLMPKIQESQPKKVQNNLVVK